MQVILLPFILLKHNFLSDVHILVSPVNFLLYLARHSNFE